MGLDITAYSKLVAAPDREPNEDRDHPAGFVQFDLTTLRWTEKNWPGRTGHLKPGVYSHGEVHQFRAGSYSGYNRWREWLAQMAGYGTPQRVWDGLVDGPFVELINFADSEGIIAGPVAAKIAKDFADHGEKFLVGADEWNAEHYRLWRKAFELAADGGAVDFH